MEKSAFMSHWPYPGYRAKIDKQQEHDRYIFKILQTFVGKIAQKNTGQFIFSRRGRLMY